MRALGRTGSAKSVLFEALGPALFKLCLSEITRPEVETGKVPQSIIDAISYVRRHDNNDVWGYSTSGTAACAPRRPVNLT